MKKCSLHLIVTAMTVFALLVVRHRAAEHSLGNQSLRSEPGGIKATLSLPVLIRT